MLERKAAQIRLLALQAVYSASIGNVGALMSVVEILVALYYGEIFGKKLLRFDPLKPGWDERDYLILSKIAAAPAHYAVLADLGFFDKSELDFLARPNALLKPYPHAKIPGVSGTFLSDGYGLSFALGLALSIKMEKKQNRVFAVLSAEELKQGQIWEAALAASHHNLDNLVVFVDDPVVEVDAAAPSSIKIEKLQQKFEAFGWEVFQVVDGHDFDQLFAALEKASRVVRRPVCIWAHTVAGRGIGFAERKAGYLRAVLSEGEMNELLSKLQTLA